MRDNRNYNDNVENDRLNKIKILYDNIFKDGHFHYIIYRFKN